MEERSFKITIRNKTYKGKIKEKDIGVPLPYYRFVEIFGMSRYHDSNKKAKQLKYIGEVIDYELVGNRFYIKGVKESVERPKKILYNIKSLYEHRHLYKNILPKEEVL